MGSRWTKEELLLVEKLYSEEREILKRRLSHRTWGSIKLHAHKLGILQKKNKCLLDFSVIDTEEKAYILGFIAADGCVYCISRKYDCWALAINLSEKDQNLLEKIKLILCPRLKLAVVKYTNVNWTTGCKLTVCDNKLCEDLKSHGIVERKSKILEPCLSVPEHLINHYIRGYFDGDGSFWIRKGRGNLHAAIYGSYDMIDWINKRVREVSPHQCNVRKQEGCYSITYTDSTAINFAKFMYRDASIYLERKFLRAEKFFSKKPHEHISDKLSGNELCRLYKELGTWTKVAEHFGVTVSYISRIKDGKRGHIGKISCEELTKK